jgi:DNA polymerase-3 subunit delta'
VAKAAKPKFTGPGPAPLIGHESVKAAIEAKIAGGHLPRVLLLTGAPGSGLQRIGQWVAQRILCTGPEAAPSLDLFGGDSAPAGPVASPCGTCLSCRQVMAGTHQEFHWHEPHENPGSDDAAVDAYEGLQAARLDERRQRAIVQPAPAGHGYYRASGTAILRKLRMMASHPNGRVVLLGNVDRLDTAGGQGAVPNMLLKTLEEPPQRTTFILTTSRPEALLDTIRSRAEQLVVPPLSASEACAVVQHAAPEAPMDMIERSVRLARGNVQRAVRFAGVTPEERTTGSSGIPERDSAKTFVKTALTGSAIARAELVASQGAKGARGQFSAMLAESGDLLRDLFQHGIKQPEFVADIDWVNDLRIAMGARHLPPIAVTRLAASVDAAMQDAQGNVAPQLLAFRLVHEMRAVAERDGHPKWMARQASALNGEPAVQVDSTHTPSRQPGGITR